MNNTEQAGMGKSDRQWQFWIDRGGTFTDVVAKRPNGEIVVHKLLSENPEQYSDAPVQGIRDCLGLGADDPIPAEQIAGIKMGTTVATNALLEHQGDRTLLVITQGFGDALRIGYQNRPNIFAREIVLPQMLYERVVEVEERIGAQGEVLIPLQIDEAQRQLREAYAQGIRSCAIALMHGYRYPKHEQALGKLARQIGFTQVSLSHQVSPLMKLVSRGDTTVVDAYLSPILRRYVDRVTSQISSSASTDDVPSLMFMQSNGGLSDAQFFQGKDSILSGPAGGIVGAVKTSELAGFEKIISFDMGGTSTDVAHYAGEYERTFDSEVAGVRLRTPMMAINTVAAGGGSIIQYDGSRYRVGPSSAGANPGPASYGRGGPLTVTDCNVQVGKLQPGFFPQVFGPKANAPLNRQVVAEKLEQLTAEIGDGRSAAAVADGFLSIAVEKMANAIKQISLQKGYDVSKYTLCCFGGAGGQHACLIAAALGMKRVLIHPYAGVLSAYGIGLAEIRVLRESSIEAPLTAELDLLPRFDELIADAEGELAQQSVQPTGLEVRQQAHLKYDGTDSTLLVNFEPARQMQQQFETKHHQRYGFVAAGKDLIVEAISIELVAQTQTANEPQLERQSAASPQPVEHVKIYTAGDWHQTPVYQRKELQPGDTVLGPALVVETTGTTVIEPDWQVEVSDRNHLILTYQASERSLGNVDISTKTADPVMLEIFNNLFRSIAEQMGTTLQNTSYSVNIKERLDFSCAVFDQNGQLVANAPHIPVHLGSMSESVKSLVDSRGDSLQPGDVYILNNPYHGGTHLPDITAITPVFDKGSSNVIFYLASRGHHADIGGITPGSMPSNSTSVEQEGVLFDNFQLVEAGRFRETELQQMLTTGEYPVRNPTQNIADLQAQIAANEKGVQELQRMLEQYGLDTVQAYMGYVQDNAEAAVRRAIDRLSDGSFTYEMDSGDRIQVTIQIDKQDRSATIDFSGTSPQLNSNFNAPSAICKAAVLYVFRTLVDDDIPLNAGCLKPLKIVIPEGCLLNPEYPAAVVAGNVETSQAIVDTLYGALGVLAASQGTMNNFTFGNQRYQYYETICGGAGAGPDFDGTDAVQTHMTNSHLTDPEVLEWRFPVLLESFSIRENSGGAGHHRGGHGAVRRLRFKEPMTAAILSSHRRIPPFGQAGGEAGSVGHNWIQRRDGSRQELASTATVNVEPGDTFVIETPGGGGFGRCST
ncbi:Hydantoinase/oxoprolinase domain family protein [Synechococcus sp. PCC 7335]|uniref:hydantoinase B/oxoprolinase family protein n=1 Tax=Synechococcus sp. (strain ATCC 29403 / PCC 7335) TaxID=91464 RepID=UPI00017ECA8D|nr:hydantoinase B/oxoprolinase family protein [Synechococcus sp. PCC 7335]EDX84576.1 Hydantoinase/oxoprolinase domain family protein [Synechococcus sp. PCC 7335]